jgi:RNase P/RNase MRP subunit p30
MAELLRIAGYSYVGLTIPTGLMRERVKLFKELFHETRIDVALRVDLSSGSRVELLRLLRRFRSSYDVVAVRCTNARVATVACRDSRVDVVYFDPWNRIIRFNHALANLLRGALELNLTSALLKEPREPVLSSLMKQCAIAKDHRVKVVLSSGSTIPEMVRSPSQLTALARTLGLSEQQSFAGVSQTPISIIERNSARRSPEFIEEGVRVVLAKSGQR